MSRTARILQDVLKSEKYGLDEYISDFAWMSEDLADILEAIGGDNEI
jgi:hypothetical protein